MKKIRIILLVFISMLLFSACGQNKSSVYRSKNLGFQINLPKSWKDKYIIEEVENGILVSYRPKDLNIRPGFLFSINKRLGELITQEDLDWSYTNQEIIQRYNGYSFIMGQAEDLQYEPDDKINTQEYMEMRKDLNDIKNSFKIYGRPERPKSKNQGYKVMASNFFQLEIREEFDLKKSKKNPFRWDVLDQNGEDIGDLELTVYNGDSFNEEGMTTRYFKDDNLKRRLRVSFKNIHAEEVETLASTLKLVDNGPISLDEIYLQEEYLKNQGRKIVGRIEAVELEGLQVNKLTVKSNKNTREYRADYPNIVTMKSGNYTLYGVYPFTGNYIVSDGEYRERTYEFILSDDDYIRAIIEIAR